MGCGASGSTLRDVAGAAGTYGSTAVEPGRTGVLSITHRESVGAGVARTDGSATGEAGLKGVFSATLRDAAGAIVSWLGLVVPCKMRISNWRDLEWLLLRGAKGKFGKGNWRAWMMSAMPALM